MNTVPRCGSTRVPAPDERQFSGLDKRARQEGVGGMSPVNERLRRDDADQLFAAILKLKTVDECYQFFEDLCTIAEVRAMAQRFAVAVMLAQGRTYEEIAQETGVSSATISRVKRCLHYGADGYRLTLDRLGIPIAPDASPGRRSL